MHEFHSVMAANQSIDMRGEYTIHNAVCHSQDIDLCINSVETRISGETHLNLDTTAMQVDNDQFRPNVTTATCLPPDNPADIVPRLIKAHKKKIKLGILKTLVITIVSVIASSICFLRVEHNAIKGESIVRPLISGIIGIITSIAILIILCSLCLSLRNGLDWMNHVLQIIQLDGKIWQDQVDSIRNTVPTKEISFPCQGNIYGRLKMRPYGHIVLAEDGIIIDELFVIRYDVYIVRGVDLIDNTIQTGCILRLFLARRLTSEKGVDKGKQIVFYLYLFMATHMQVQMLADIRESILSNSHRCLTASGFKNARINLQ